MVTFGEPLGHVITLCGQILVRCRVLMMFWCECVCCGVRCRGAVAVWCVDSTRARVIMFETLPCVPAKRAHVETPVRLAGTHVKRFERTHGHVLNRHTGFVNGHTTPPQHHDNAHHNTHTRTQDTTQHNDTTTVTTRRHRDRDRGRQRQRQDRRRRDKTKYK